MTPASPVIDLNHVLSAFIVFFAVDKGLETEVKVIVRNISKVIVGGTSEG
jgi:hypothetical protein